VRKARASRPKYFRCTTSVRNLHVADDSTSERLRSEVDETGTWRGCASCSTQSAGSRRQPRYPAFSRGPEALRHCLTTVLPGMSVRLTTRDARRALHRAWLGDFERVWSTMSRRADAARPVNVPCS
jgi:hypothetical protein